MLGRVSGVPTRQNDDRHCRPTMTGRVSCAVAGLGLTFGGGSRVAIIAAGGHGPILPH